jgi:uncharacterized protein (DUF2132 family)
MPSPSIHPRDPLHGITLENILNQLVQRHGWGEMGRRIPIIPRQMDDKSVSNRVFYISIFIMDKSVGIREHQTESVSVL